MSEASTDTLPQTKASKDAANVASMSDYLLNPSAVDWLVRDPLTKFGGDKQGNPFSVLVDLVPHDQLEGASGHMTQNMMKWMIYYQLCVSTFLVSYLFA
jgi:hypothetical protein